MSKRLLLTGLLGLLGLLLAHGGEHPFLAFLEARLAQVYSKEQPEKLYLHLDQTWLQPGEDLWFAGYLLDAQKLKGQGEHILRLELRDAQDKVKQEYQIVTDSQGRFSGALRLDESLKQGGYKLKCHFSLWEELRFEREITIFKPVLPRLSMKLDFRRQGYAPGDWVEAELRLQDLEGKPLAGLSWKAALYADVGKPLAVEGKTDAQGLALIRVKLPQSKKLGQASLSVNFKHLGVTESIAREVPLALKDLELTILPEGGHIIAGMSQQVAFKALNPQGKGLDVSGIVLDESGQQVAEFASYYRGMGEFKLKPEAHKTYTLKVLKPIQKEIQMPFAWEIWGLSLDTETEDWKLKVFAPKTDSAFILVQQQGRVLHRQALKAEAGENLLLIPSGDFPMGICEISLLTKGGLYGQYQAQRLAFAGLGRQIQVDIQPRKKQYQPREEIVLDLKLKDSKGLPVSGTFSLSVAEEKRLSLADDRQGRILAELFLRQELKGEIEDPDFYFETGQEAAERLGHIQRAKALDLLLRCQGWRGFKLNEKLDQSYFRHKHRTKPRQALKLVDFVTGKPIDKAAVYINDSLYGYSDSLGRIELFLPQYVNKTFQLKILKTGYWEEESSPYNLANVKSLIRMLPEDLSRLNFKINYFNKLDWRSALEPWYFSLTLGHYTSKDSFVYKIYQHQELYLGKGYDSLYLEFPEYMYPGKYLSISLDTGLKEQEVDLIFACKPEYEDRAQGRVRALGDTIWLDCRQVKSRDTVLIRYRSPIFQENYGQIEGGMSMTSEQIERMATRDIGTVVASTAGVNQRDEGESSSSVYVDGVRVFGANGITEAEVKPIHAEDDTKKPEAQVRGLWRQELSPAELAKVQERVFYVPPYQTEPSAASAFIREDFRATLYFNPAVKVENGQGQVRFPASDELSRFRVYLEGIDQQGRAVQGKGYVQVQKPLSMDLRLPPDVQEGDQLRLPLSLNNRSAQPQKLKLSLQTPTWLNLAYPAEQSLELAAGEFKVIYLPLSVEGFGQGEFILSLYNEQGEQQDRLALPLQSRIRGFEQFQHHNYLNKAAKVELPNYRPGTLKAQLLYHDQGLKDILAATKDLHRLPTGCFEQTSSSNYPNLLVLDYIRRHQAEDKALDAQFLTYVKAGHKRLSGFEAPGGGFDWWGYNPANPFLTAYGILQFRDMQRLLPGMDSSIIHRAETWLLSQRDGDGGWKTFSSNNPALHAYIVWALSESGQGGRIAKEISKSLKLALKNQDPYQLALVGNAAMARGDTAQAQACFKALKRPSETKGRWTGATEGVCYSSGLNLDIETSALVALLCTRLGERELAKEALHWIAQQKSYCGYGSTQGTILYLKARLAYLEHYPAANKQLEDSRLILDGKELMRVNAKDSASLAQAELHLAEALKPGEHQVHLELGGNQAWSLELSYFTAKPQAWQPSPLKLQTQLAKSKLNMGEYCTLEVVLENKSAKTQNMAMAMIGLPAGMSVSPQQLKTRQEAGDFDFYEIFEGCLVLHFKALTPKEKRQIRIELKAEIPGTYQGPSSSAFPYYEAQARHWIEPLSVDIQP